MTTWTTEDNPIKAKRRENEDRWANMPVHPAAEALQMMSKAEIAELAKDIEANGLQVPFVVLRDNSTAPQGDEGPYPEYLLDGRCRREALKLLGIKHPNGARTGQGGHEEKVRYYDLLTKTMTLGSSKATWVTNVDPDKFVMSLNVHRRHLTAEQKATAIANLIVTMPMASDREIARQAGVAHTTVSRARKKTDRNGATHQSDRSPLERAKMALLADPNQTSAVIAEALGIGATTVRKARGQLIAAGEIEQRLPTSLGGRPPKADVPKPKPAAPKPSAAEKAAARKAEQITADITAFAVAAEDLRNAAKKLVQHQLTESQCAKLQGIIKETNLELRTIPTTNKEK